MCFVFLLLWLLLLLFLFECIKNIGELIQNDSQLRKAFKNSWSTQKCLKGMRNENIQFFSFFIFSCTNKHNFILFIGITQWIRHTERLTLTLYHHHSTQMHQTYVESCEHFSFETVVVYEKEYNRKKRKCCLCKREKKILLTIF